MIQRVQTVLLFFVAVAMVLVMFSTLWEQINPDNTEKLSLTAWTMTTYSVSAGSDDTVQQEQNHFLIGVLSIIAAVVALYSLSQFKNRTKQMFLNMINSLVMGVLLGVTVYQSYQANTEFNPVDSGTFVLGFYAIVAGIILNVLSNRFIRRDEMLVRSVDRIR